jgi:FkbM family methyltransferase
MLWMRIACLRLFGVFPARLPFGGWWLGYNDYNGNTILMGRFETAERNFVEAFLRPEMTVLDIGAHHGFYSLLAARKVGPTGRVVAFEPSPRERQRLDRHLWLNRCANVQVESFALGSSDAEADLFQVVGADTGCNSLRPPNVEEPTKVVRVPVTTLDSYLNIRKIEHVEFIKMDVEGAEWEVLKGAIGLLERRPRPVILCEVQEIRTQPWGYRGKEVVEFLRCRRFSWFYVAPKGSLEALDVQQENFDGNFVAIPQERLEQFTAGGMNCGRESVVRKDSDSKTLVGSSVE